MVKKSNLLSNFYLISIILFLYLPIVILILFSFNNSSSVKWTGFTFKWYEELMDQNILDALRNTLTVALIATVVSTIVGTIASIGIYNMTSKAKKTVLTINNIPILNPDIVTGVSIMILFMAFSLPFGYWTMLIAHIIFDIPYVILAIFPKLKQLDPNLLEAALDLGAKPNVAIRKVIIPQLLPGIITGALIAFTMSIDDFVISYFNTANGDNNLSIWIYSQTKKGVDGRANAVSTVMLLIVIAILLVIALRLSKDFKKKEYTK